MTWFKVDDSFHAHPKVLATDADALGLWVVAGAWSSSHLTDGFVPDHALPRLLPGSDDLARKLVTAGLWRKARGGYRFHDWNDFNPKREDVEGERKAARERMRKLRSGRKGAGDTPNGSGEQSANVRGVFATPTRPDPFLGGALRDPLTPGARVAPSPLCPEHENDPDPPDCGRCAEARRARQHWEVADSNRRRTAEKCRLHRGQPADNCALCRSEELEAS
jgi:hypothetical protein